MSTSSDCLSMSMLASPAAPGLARTLTEARILKWGDSHILDDAFLIVSELITNAITETPGKQIHFRLTRDRIYLVVAVWDSSPRTPHIKQPTPTTPDTLDLSPAHWDDNGGWGLPLVTALAIDCGCKQDPRGGKWVWARLKP
ncbi:Anti-sigma regulatory factor (Ser/Thr protein kinase) [Thermomonospora echinospora]|uniref:Anti-sigma regulatory factor (Ser/Thr protein kinase) n=1 Tax=Thermomonospora echinospora TaxID=1992 RepID=A0A1H6CNJ5_9ACTN|nr:ATP-binding protein [Thermomonospora echinospora]SEG74337.1 Anti-sigma regulatory factor (Ser/Thr protein kinase) [Thermomonospora echinospora]